MIEYGKTVLVCYIGTFDDGTVFDSTEDKDPLEFALGSGMLIHGFDEAVRGMEVGQKIVVHVPMEEAFGEYSDQRQEKIPLYALMPASATLKVGDTFYFLPEESYGEAVPAKLLAVEEGMATVDFNHPLSGKDLNYTIELLEIKD